MLLKRQSLYHWSSTDTKVVVPSMKPLEPKSCHPTPMLRLKQLNTYGRPSGSETPLPAFQTPMKDLMLDIPGSSGEEAEECSGICSSHCPRSRGTVPCCVWGVPTPVFLLRAVLVTHLRGHCHWLKLTVTIHICWNVAPRFLRTFISAQWKTLSIATSR